jgi:pSer/pThr/pTyr-binding forkhead associated (FHA) protein
MVYSTCERVAEPLREAAASEQRTALLLMDGKRFVIGADGVTLGRSRHCDVTVDDPNVSRTHAEIRARGGSWVVTDLGSTNGSRLNGRSLDQPTVLKPGDEIELGTTTLQFSLG